ncbi:hypothetical protein FKM82_015042 [Ascaphus truei]
MCAQCKKLELQCSKIHALAIKVYGKYLSKLLRLLFKYRNKEKKRARSNFIRTEQNDPCAGIAQKKPLSKIKSHIKTTFQR